jgi:hypothetical protein
VADWYRSWHERWRCAGARPNGSAAYADIDSGVAVAVMRSRCDADLALVGEVDRIVADSWPLSVRAGTRREE